MSLLLSSMLADPLETALSKGAKRFGHFAPRDALAVPSAGRLAEGSPDGYFNARRVWAPQTGILMPGLPVYPQRYFNARSFDAPSAGILMPSLSVLPLVCPQRVFRCTLNGYFNARPLDARSLHVPLMGIGMPGQKGQGRKRKTCSAPS